MKTEIVVTDMSLDDIFIAMQPTEEDREEARRWIRSEQVRCINTINTVSTHEIIQIIPR